MSATGTTAPSYSGSEALADALIGSADRAGTTGDAFFRAAARETLSLLLFASLVSLRGISDVAAWSRHPDAEDGFNPVEALHEHGQDEASRALTRIEDLPRKQREAIYGTIRSWFAAIDNLKRPGAGAAA